MLLAALGIVGGVLGGGYTWASSVYSYNRDAWMTDIQVLQNHDYQYDNMQITTHQMSRDQIRDRTEAAITKLNNYILVTTLIIALAGEVLVEGQVPEETVDFVLNVFMLSLGSSFLYLALGTLFGVAASNVIYESSAELLTTQVKPPWAIIDKKMRTREAHKMTQAFETRPYKQIFTPPLFRRIFRKHFEAQAKEEAEEEEEALERTERLEMPERRERPAGGGMGVTFDPDLEEQPVGRMFTKQSRRSVASTTRKRAQLNTLGVWGEAESLDGDGGDSLPGGEEEGTHENLEEIRQDYEERWAQKESEWMPLFTYSRRCTALGVHSLLQAYGYLCMANLYGQFGSAWAFWAAQLIFTSLNMIITQAMFEIGSTWYGFVTVGAGPMCCALAATTPFKWVDRILVPMCYMSHLLLHNLLDMPLDLTFEGHVEGLLCELHTAQDAKAQSDEQEFHVDEDSASTAQSPPSSPKAVRQVWASPHSHLKKSETHMEKEHQKLQETVGLMLQMGKYVMRSLWALSVLWSLCKSYSNGEFHNEDAVIADTPKQGEVAITTVVGHLSWSSPYFKPQTLVCPGKKLFISDEYQIFEVDIAQGMTRPYSQCELSTHTIVDLTSDCNESGDCWPVVLMSGLYHGDAPAIYDCRTHRAEKLLQLQDKPLNVAWGGTGEQQALFVATRDKVLQYKWSPTRQGWAPLWTVASARNVHAIDVVGEHLLLFRNYDTRVSKSGSAVEILNVKKAISCGTWELPANLLGAGCAVPGGGSVLTLNLLTNVVGKGVQLFHANLKMTVEECMHVHGDAETGLVENALSASAATASE